MNRHAERLLLQAVILVLCLSPFVFGLQGIVRGVAQYGAVASADADSHYRYLSGIFFGVGIMALSCVPRIEQRGERFGWVVALVFCGGLARLYGIVFHGWPSAGHITGLGLELGVTPLLGLWQRRLARRFA